MYQQKLSDGVYMIYNADRMYLFVHQHIVDQYFSSASLEYMLTPIERDRLFKQKSEQNKSYEIYKDMDCAVAFKELTGVNAIKDMILSPENLDNTLYRRYSDYTEWYNENNPQHKITEQYDWVDDYLEVHKKQQEITEKAIESFQPPFDVLSQIPFDKAFPHFQYLLDKLPWECSGPLENYYHSLYDSIFFDTPKRLIKKRVWLGMSYLLYGLQHFFHLKESTVISRQATEYGLETFKKLIQTANYEKAQKSEDIEKYDHCPIKQLAEMIKSDTIHFNENA